MPGRLHRVQGKAWIVSQFTLALSCQTDDTYVCWWTGNTHISVSLPTSVSPSGTGRTRQVGRQSGPSVCQPKSEWPSPFSWLLHLFGDLLECHLSAQANQYTMTTWRNAHENKTPSTQRTRTHKSSHTDGLVEIQACQSMYRRMLMHPRIAG